MSTRETLVLVYALGAFVTIALVAAGDALEGKQPTGRATRLLLACLWPLVVAWCMLRGLMDLADALGARFGRAIGQAVEAKRLRAAMVRAMSSPQGPSDWAKSHGAVLLERDQRFIPTSPFPSPPSPSPTAPAPTAPANSDATTSSSTAADPPSPSSPSAPA